MQILKLEFWPLYIICSNCARITRLTLNYINTLKAVLHLLSSELTFICAFNFLILPLKHKNCEFIVHSIECVILTTKKLHFCNSIIVAVLIRKAAVFHSSKADYALKRWVFVNIKFQTRWNCFNHKKGRPNFRLILLQIRFVVHVDSISYVANSISKRNNDSRSGAAPFYSCWKRRCRSNNMWVPNRSQNLVNTTNTLWLQLPHPLLHMSVICGCVYLILRNLLYAIYYFIAILIKVFRSKPIN